MGGQGSGNYWRSGAKDCADDYNRLDVRHCARAGMLEPGRSTVWKWRFRDEVVAAINVRVETDRLVLKYRHGGDGDVLKHENYVVRIVRTPCRFGGTRPWFLCPVRGCERRVAVLYGGGIFACRQCHELAYRSSRESVSDRAARRADKARARLGWEPGILNGSGDKPKWMRWETFERLYGEHDDGLQLFMQAIVSITDRRSRRRRHPGS
jgi:hypothetical protein